MPESGYSEFRSRTCWPDEHQRALLRAIVGPEAERRTAWQSFQSARDIGSLDGASNAIVSLVWTSVGEDGIAPEERNRIKGTWRHQWVRLQNQRNAFREVAPAIASHGIEVVLLGETASAFADYPEGVLRPWSSLRLATRSEMAPDAARTLRDLGWMERSGDDAAPGAQVWEKGELAIVELRSALFPEGDTNDRLWPRLSAIRVEEADVRILPRDVRLIQLAYEGIRWMPETPLPAFVDAAMIIGQMTDDDRRALLATAREWRMVLAVRTLAGFLDGIGVPGAVEIVETLRHEKTSIAEQIEMRLRRRENGTLLLHARDWFHARRPRRV